MKKYNDDLINTRYLTRPDKFRIAAAFLVVVIHTSPFASFSANADFIFTRVIARTAVPFFLMATGYFLLPQYLFGRSMDKRLLAGALRKHLRLYLAAVFLYLPVNLYAGQFQELTVGGFLRMFFIDGTFYHLWYLPAAMTGLLLVWFLGTRLPFKVLMGISLVLYGIGLFGDSYYGFAEQIPVVKSFYGLLFSVSSYTRNGLFYVPLFLVMGAGMQRDGYGVDAAGRNKCGKTAQRRGREKIKGIGLAVSLALMTAEGMALHRLHYQRHDSMYLMLPPVMYFLFRLLLAEKLPETLPDGSSEKKRPHRGKRLRGVSTCIYLIHPFCIILVRGMAKAAGLESLFVENSMLHCLAVCAVSWTGACLLVSAAEKIGEQTDVFRERKGDFEKGRAWIEVSGENLARNVATLRRFLVPGQRLMPALKADAYGHGAVPVAGELQKMGIDAFCVACAAEGAALRKNGITGDILILGYTHPQDLPLLRKYRLTQTVVDCDHAKVLNRRGGPGGKIKVHIKIDTGMHRLGERAEKIKEIDRIFRMKNLKVEGVYTHLCADETRDEEDMTFTRRQAALFDEAVGKLRKRGYQGLKTHLLASYGLLNYPEFGGDFVRVGIALYGVFSDRGAEEGSAGKGSKNFRAELMPVLSLRARIAAVKEVHPGESVGYGRAYVAKDVRKIAVLAIGYGDGLPRSLSNGVGSVLIHGQSAPVAGRICMDQMMVDITGIADVKPGESATVIGRDGNREITVYELAEKAGTITNEILSRLGARLPRLIV